MADYPDRHNDFFYTKGATGLEAVIRLRKVRKLLALALTEIKYVFPQHIAHGELIDRIDNGIISTIHDLDNVLQKKRN